MEKVVAVRIEVARDVSAVQLASAQVGDDARALVWGDLNERIRDSLLEVIVLAEAVSGIAKVADAVGNRVAKSSHCHVLSARVVRAHHGRGLKAKSIGRHEGCQTAERELA